MEARDFTRKQTYQEHFIDLCHLVDHQTPNEADPTGTRFAFEMGAAKTSGGQGWADVAKLDYFGWEYKGKDADLDKAYNQLLSYRDALRNPPLLIVSDINQIIIRTNYTNLPTRTFVITLEDMLDPESLKILKTVFFNPEQLKPHETVESVTQALRRNSPGWLRTCADMAMTRRRLRIFSSACYSVCLRKTSGCCRKGFFHVCWNRRVAIRRISPKCSSNSFAR
jgi:hypothetical protein